MGFSQHKILTNHTQLLSDYIKNSKYEQFPSEVVERAKMIIMQVLGVSLATKSMPEASKAIALARKANGGKGGEATVWTDGSKLSMENAALANGVLADLLGWGDCAWTGHPSCGIVPVAWVISEALRLSGKDLITSIIVAYDVYQRIAMAIHPTWEEWDQRGHRRGINSWQIFGPISVAAKLMGFDELKTNKVLSMGTTCCVIPACFHDSMPSDVYHFEQGFRNQTAVTLGRLAQAEVENLEDGLDDPAAFGSHFTAYEKNEWYTKDIGEKYLIMETMLKHWPADMWLQTIVELGYGIVTQNEIAPENIKEIIVKPGIDGRMDISDDGFNSITKAQYSIPFVLAAMVFDHKPGAHWYTFENMTNPKVIDLAKKVKRSDDSPDSLTTGLKMFTEGTYPLNTIGIKTKDGRIFEESMDCPFGHPKNMMAPKQFAESFRIQASPVLSDDKTNKAIDILLNLENCKDISSLEWMLHA